jgi:RNA polymerase sigma-54 factor
MDLKQKQAQSLRQMQRLMMSPQMQQALQLLQLPILELSTTIEIELQQNPVIEPLQEDQMEEENIEPELDGAWEPEKELTFDDKSFEILRKLDEEFRDYISDTPVYSNGEDEEKLRSFQESSVLASPSLFEFLMRQAYETWERPEELMMAEAIIGSFDERGFLQNPLEEIAALGNFDVLELEAILFKIQEFEPSGVGANNLQESLLLQLRHKHKENSLAYQIIKEEYDNLLHNRIPLIQKNLGCTLEELKEELQRDILRLDLRPGASYTSVAAQPIIPDLTLEIQNDSLEVVIEEDFLPSFRFNRRYLRMLNDESVPIETKDFIKQKIVSAKWLLRNIHQRNETLFKIGKLLAEKQTDFFMSPSGLLLPMTMKQASEQLGVHESTIARAVAHKYLFSPRGLFPLRYFFTTGFLNQEGEDVSSATIKELLKEIIKKEDKSRPFSDESIARQINSRGIPCARRTISEYRAALDIRNAHQRRQF